MSDTWQSGAARTAASPREAPGHELTELLRQASRGQEQANHLLFRRVYGELHRMAQGQLRQDRRHHFLNTTGLVHEAYIKLFDGTAIDWQNRRHFFGLAARAMRQVRVDTARRRLAAKRNGGRGEEAFDEERFIPEHREQEVIDLDQALTRLAALNPRWSEIVEYLYFGGLTQQETADLLGVNVRTVERHWARARVWLYNEINGGPEPSEPSAW